jgi:hypothetical protein
LGRKGILVVLALAATLAVGVPSASATERFTTHIVFLGTGGKSEADTTLFGDLNTRPTCRGARTVELFKKTNRGFRLIDIDLSSFNGAWALRADLTGSPDLAVQVKRDKRRHGRIVCKAATLSLSPNPPA